MREFFRDLFFECPPLLFRLGQLFFENRVLRFQRFVLGLKCRYFLFENRRKGDFFEEVKDAHKRQLDDN